MYNFEVTKYEFRTMHRGVINVWASRLIMEWICMFIMEWIWDDFVDFARLWIHGTTPISSPTPVIHHWTCKLYFSVLCHKSWIHNFEEQKLDGISLNHFNLKFKHRCLVK